jgi:hypothetical protein
MNDKHRLMVFMKLAAIFSFTILSLLFVSCEKTAPSATYIPTE